MRKQSLFKLLGVMWVMCLSLMARGQTIIPITGPDTVCINSFSNYSIPPLSGISLNWHTTSRGYIYLNTGINVTLTWNSTGLDTVSFGGYNSSGVLTDTGTIVVYIEPMPSPYITTNFRVACRADSLDSMRANFTPTVSMILSDTSGCVNVCDSSIVTYTANGSARDKFGWAVTGGSVLSSTATTVTIRWGTAGTPASLTLSDTSAWGCVATKTVCINIIDKPQASFVIEPDTTPVSIYHICSGTTLCFENKSTPSTGTTVWWNFGDGITSTASSGTICHTFTASSGQDTVTLAITNNCGCSDTFRTILQINSTSAPIIQCTQVACQGDTASYSTTASCGSYTWSVSSGATIIAGAGTNHIVVRWNSADADGMGYVYLTDPCAPCPAATTLQVPIIQSNPTISMPSGTLCTGFPYQFSLPLWPGTQYDWGVISNPFAVINGRNDHTVTLNFSTPGTYTVHVWYQNRIKLCGGDRKFNITVNPATSIVGATTACSGSTQTYHLSSGSGTWTLNGPGGFTQTFPTASSITTSFPAGAGTYSLSVSGATICSPPPFVINAQPQPTTPTISGPNTVCLNDPQTYTVNSVPGTTVNWGVTGGTILGAASGNGVTVKFTSTGTKSITATRTSLISPYCPSALATMSVTTFPHTATIGGTVSVCSNSSYTYSVAYTDPDDISWSIYPNVYGSVTGFNNSPTAGTTTVLFHNAPSVESVDVIAKIRKCDTTWTDTMVVTLNPAALVAITCPAVTCSDSVIFTASSGAGSYIWSFSDGQTATGNPVMISFDNTTSTEKTYTATVTATGSSGGGCPPSGTNTISFEVLPTGQVTISTHDPLSYCPDSPIHTTFTATVTNDFGPPFTYQWYDSAGPISGATSSTYTATSYDLDYYVIVRDANGCSAKSNVMSIYDENCDSAPHCLVSIATSVSCGTITAVATGSGLSGASGYTWTYPPGYSSVSGLGTTTLVITYPISGIYGIGFSATYPDTCTAYNSVSVIVPALTKFNYTVNCPGTAGGYNFTFSDASSAMGVTGYAWTITPGSMGSTLPSWSTTLSSGTTYTVQETVTTLGGGSCSYQTTIGVQAPPTPSFSYSPSSICEDIPVAFNYTGTGTIRNSLLWLFGDNATSSFISSLDRTYKWPGGIANPHIFYPKLIVTDTFGCTYADSASESIWHNILAGTVSGGGTACAGPVTISYSSSGGVPTSYAWTNTITSTTYGTGATSSYNAYVTGNYIATVTDVHQCVSQSGNSANVSLIGVSGAAITGTAIYCQGQTVTLYGYMGSSYAYTWLRNGVAVSSSATLKDAGLPAGSYNYQLIVSDGVCAETTAVYPVTINPLPSPPSINLTSVSCTPYKVQMTASGGSGTYNWSNGVTGTTDIVSTGGGYRVWITDVHGCQNYADADVPYAPDYYFGWFPSGCYDLCTNMLPIYLYGPPGTNFASWAWLPSGPSGGLGTSIRPMTISGANTYDLRLNTRFCTATAPSMNVATKSCSCPPILFTAQTYKPSIVCDPNPGDPAGYVLTLYLENPSSSGPTTYTIGMNEGPVVPFSGTVTSTSPTMVTLNFTTLRVPPTNPDTIMIHYVMPGGQECYQMDTITLPTCSWLPERLAHPVDTGAQLSTVQQAATGMMIYPNPATRVINVNYNYAVGSNADRRITLYDMTGRRITTTPVTTVTGTVNLPVGDLPAGSYIVRMEENGKAVHTQHLAVTH